MTALGISFGLWGILAFIGFVMWLKKQDVKPAEMSAEQEAQIKALHDRLNTLELSVGMTRR